MSKFKAVIPFPGRLSSASNSQTNKSKLTNHFVGSSISTSIKSDIPVSFYRLELNLILAYYGRMVAKGEWRDYAIDMRNDRAIFSIFQHTSDQPLFRVEKQPKLARKQGAFRIIGSAGQILKRGHDLAQVLKLFDKKFDVISG